jgi:hypothetical protein
MVLSVGCEKCTMEEYRCNAQGATLRILSLDTTSPLLFLPQLILFNEMQTNSTTFYLLKQDRCRKGIEKSVFLTPSEHYDIAHV